MIFKVFKKLFQAKRVQNYLTSLKHQWKIPIYQKQSALSY